MIAQGIAGTVLPLESLRANEHGSIVELVGEQREVHRLAEMGLRVGAFVKMVRPGAPCLLALDGKRMSIRLGNEIDVLVSATT